MTEPAEVLRLVRQWVKKAENDFTAASMLGLGRKCPTDAVCYHVQQCVEKYLKSILVLHGLVHPKTHDIRLLVAQLPEKERPPIALDVQRQLTGYAVVTRYPGDYSDPTLAEAREAVKVARRVRAWCRKLLPPAALRKGAREAE